MLVLVSSACYAQSETNTIKDTLIYKQKYGLRVGLDLSKIVRSFLDENYTGIELMGDYRLTKRLYLAAELGNEERTLEDDLLSNTSKGSYFKGGIDMNFYRNWLDMENMIYGGLRVGASTFSQTRERYEVYNVNNQYWDQQVSVETPQEFSGLTALWTELIVGLKAELFTNFYAGINVQLKFLITETAPENYENLYIPGFNRTYDSGSFGSGYGFNLAYLIPIFKKDKVVVQERSKEE
jgi:hypothetical protein